MDLQTIEDVRLRIAEHKKRRLQWEEERADLNRELSELTAEKVAIDFCRKQIENRIALIEMCIHAANHPEEQPEPAMEAPPKTIPKREVSRGKKRVR